MRLFGHAMLLGVAALLSSCGGGTPPASSGSLPPAPPGNALRPVSDFDVFADPGQRSQALFAEASRVFLHPRCTNCHPAGDAPLQGDHGYAHEPPVVRGPDNNGVVGMECDGCHQEANQELARVPGAPSWHLAPRSMAWVGESASSICEQIKDPARNGGKTVPQIVEHTAHDALVAWGWDPGHGRSKAPGTQQDFAALMEAWAEHGAVCPDEERSNP